jgi:hypothetical protein
MHAVKVLYLLEFLKHIIPTFFWFSGELPHGSKKIWGPLVMK